MVQMYNVVSEPKNTIVVIVSLLFFFSGAAALVYEVLWMKELSLLFGNSAQAAAATLAAFFTGLAAGNTYWGRRASRLNRPLLVYGILELCITLSATLYFAVYVAYDAVYPILFGAFEQSPTFLTATKFVLALILFFPAAFFMGGTLPVMTQYFVRNYNTLGKRASVLYTLNTFGAATGSLAAGFYLPQALGVDNSYFLAMLMTLSVGIVAVVLGRSSDSVASRLVSKNESSQPPHNKKNKQTVPRNLIVLAMLSGFASLALQVLWIRMFAQVLHNSVYSYSAILAIFLIALALGGAIAREVARREIVGQWFLPCLLSLSAVLVAASPMVFYFLTDNGSYIGGDEGFSAYLLQIFVVISIVIGIPTLIIGILLPYLFKLAESRQASPGEIVGRLITVNTIGAISGSIIAGFVLLNWVGLWSSIRIIASLYIAAAICCLMMRPPTSRVMKLVPIFSALLLVTVLNTSQLPVVKIDSRANKETLLKVWEGADATVAVVQQNGYLYTKLNNWYTLGSTGDMTAQQIQSHIPLLLHPNPKQVFYLGLGTGITAGTALEYQVDEVIVSELSPSAIRASQEFFAEYTNGLYSDPRVKVIAEDGRNVLRGSRKSYDLIISDLFIPWKAGTGSLYSVEHYETALGRLTAGGMYAQWLPLYQLTRDEFAIIARSMLEVFPMVSMWRGNFRADGAVVALIGHQESASLTTKSPLFASSTFALREWTKGEGSTLPLITHYLGTLNAEHKHIADAPLNTDNYPLIEYLAPINHRLEKSGQLTWFLEEQLFDFMRPYSKQQTLNADTYLATIDPAWREVIEAGYYLHLSHMLQNKSPDDLVSAQSTYRELLTKAANVLVPE